MNNNVEIPSAVSALQSELFTIREHLHKYPELSFEEHETARFIRTKLKEYGYEYVEIGNTGTVVVINPQNASKGCVALRADIDALPIMEKNETPYKSINQGVMHACGHDVHTTILLGVAKYLSLYPSEQCIKLIFQPGEEKLPGGASLLIKEGVLKNPNVDKIIGLHVFPELNSGEIGFREGIYMASCDELHVEIKGVGGHGALPHKVKDPVLAGSELISSLQRIVSRAALPTIPSVLSFGYFKANGATNVIPEKVTIKGTFRTLNEEWREKAHELIQETSSGIAKAHQVDIKFDIKKGYPFLMNDVMFTREVKNNVIRQFGKENVKELPIRMTAEDFSYYSHHVPACFFRLGTNNEKNTFNKGVHHPEFDIDKTALGVGVTAMLSAINEL